MREYKNKSEQRSWNGHNIKCYESIKTDYKCIVIQLLVENPNSFKGAQNIHIWGGHYEH